MFDNQNIVTNNDVIKNVFSSDQINLLYKNIDLDYNKNIMLQDFYGRLYIPLYWRQETNISGPIDLTIDQTISDLIVKQSANFSNVPLQIESISFARYSLKYGTPCLHPHSDTNFKQARLTFDVQLGGNINWPILVENKEYLLKNNDAIVFSGTHEVHWRDKKTFAKGEYLDMIFAHLHDPESENIKDSHKTNMKIKSNYYLKMWEMERR
jgi:hypothetical protein